jgi:hypothetical protein
VRRKLRTRIGFAPVVGAGAPQLLLPGATVIAGVLVLLGAGGNISSLALGLLLLVSPAAPLVAILHLPGAAFNWTLTMALSLSMEVVVSAATLYWFGWHPRAVIVALLVTCVGASALQIVVEARQRQAATHAAPTAATLPEP